MNEEIKALSAKAAEALESVKDGDSLESWRLTYLSRKGELSRLMSGLGTGICFTEIAGSRRRCTPCTGISKPGSAAILCLTTSIATGR